MQSVRELVPRRLRRTLVATRNAWMDEPCWHGVYPDFATVPVAGPGFNSQDWSQEAWVAFQNMEIELDERALATTWRYSHHELAAFYLASATPSCQSVHILDFGGGMAPDYLHLRTALPGSRNIRYSVVESQAICDHVASLDLGSRYPELNWVPSWTHITEPIDLVLMNAVLQYVDDWQELIRGLVQMQPRAFLVVRAPLGSFRTYASGQINHAPSVIPCWFFNDYEFKEAFETLGYRCRFQGVHDRVYEQVNFPGDLRCPKRSYLLFERE